MESFKIGNSVFSINSKLQNVTSSIHECEMIGGNISKLKTSNVSELYKNLKKFQKRTHLALVRFSLSTKSPDDCFGLVNLFSITPDSIVKRAWRICTGEYGFEEGYATACQGTVGDSKPFTTSSYVKSSTNLVNNSVFGLLLFVLFGAVFGWFYFRLIRTIYSNK